MKPVFDGSVPAFHGRGRMLGGLCALLACGFAVFDGIPDFRRACLHAYGTAVSAMALELMEANPHNRRAIGLWNHACRVVREADGAGQEGQNQSARFSVPLRPGESTPSDALSDEDYERLEKEILARSR